MASRIAPLTALLLLAASQLVGAQTFTICDPTKKTCPPLPALGRSISVDLTNNSDGTSLSPFVKSIRGPLAFDTEGLILLSTEPSNAPTVSISKYIFYGRVDVTMRTAPGVGIVTSLVLASDDLDEIDFEWVGSDNNQMQTNYFSKGCTATYDRGAYHAIKNSTAEFHTYSVNWTPERLDWLVDGVVTRTLLAETVKTSSCGGFPQAPMKVDVGSWVAGKKDASPGTIEWAGGLADFSNGPLKTYIKSINVTDDAKGVKNAVQYRYTDMSGRAESIVVETAENATVVDTLEPSAPPSGLPVDSGRNGQGLGSGAMAGIVIGVVAVAGAIAGLVWVVLRKRRRRQEKQKLDSMEKASVDDKPDIVGGVDAKQELDGNTVSEMDAERPPARELDAKEIMAELQGNEDVDSAGVSPMSPDTSPRGGSPVRVDEKEEDEVHELPGDVPQR